MPATRTRDGHKNGEKLSSKSKSKSKHQNHHRIDQEQASNVAPGMQKVKAALRQTRRLLAKDNLAADVRVETERRLKALEAELQQAEVAKKERAFAVRYHKIKFFERQKVTRKLGQTKKALETAEDDLKKRKSSTELYELRVDLNYILHYPKSKKYISLYPPQVRKGEEAHAALSADTKKTDEDREEVRKWIRQQMEHGGLSSEPELEAHGSGNLRAQKWLKGTQSVDIQPQIGKSDDVQEDDFFGEDEDESS